MKLSNSKSVNIRETLAYTKYQASIWGGFYDNMHQSDK